MGSMEEALRAGRQPEIHDPAKTETIKHVQLQTAQRT
jgi:hypothetical protein